MQKKLFTGILALLAWMPATAHVWDELAILARPNDKGTFTLEIFMRFNKFINNNISIMINLT